MRIVSGSGDISQPHKLISLPIPLYVIFYEKNLLQSKITYALFPYSDKIIGVLALTFISCSAS